ncbi:hypothetical protein OROHE_019620 [Orobanche hederae]
MWSLVTMITSVRREKKLQKLLRLEGYTGSYELENRSGRTAEGQDIAVKLLPRQSRQGLVEFKNELIIICVLQHVNLVKLIGFCDYMPNKSLNCFLFIPVSGPLTFRVSIGPGYYWTVFGRFSSILGPLTALGPSKRESLDWPKRFNIIEGTAQGLLCPHKHSYLRVIHPDMNPQALPKSLILALQESLRRVGTYGYIAPEYAMQGIFSVKSDIYSFGVVVLEIVAVGEIVASTISKAL